MKKSPMGFNGNGLWPVVALLVAGVAWIQQNTDFRTAAYAVIAVGGVLAVVVGFMLALGAKRVTFDGIIGLKEAESRIEIERAKERRLEAANEGKFEQKLLSMATVLGRQIGAHYKAQVDAGQTTKPNDNPFVIDLNEIDYRYREDEL